MKPTGAQDFEPGDIAALTFDDPEAHHIARTAKALLGTVIREPQGLRGISWSDMAVLLRSVKNNGDPILRAFQEENVPFVILGMNSLFQAPEAEAARILFYFMGGRDKITEKEVLKAWEVADVGASTKVLQTAIKDAATLIAGGDDTLPYSPQTIFLNFIEALGIRLDTVPYQRGEIVLYNLGKFSQVISDFESIYFRTQPTEKYKILSDFLFYTAEGAYAEGWQDNQYANPDAVRVMTIHQAKGMQWPVVFIPALLRNRFPAPRMGGKSVWHLLPREAVKGQQRYEGTLEDERRLFYVAMTRSQKYLCMTWAPIPGVNRYQRASEFWENILTSKWVKRRVPEYTKRKRLKPNPRANISNVVFTFSDLKYFFECPYQFKLRILYGFNPPIHEALGYGKSLHDMLAEVHNRAIRGDIADELEVDELVGRHLRLPYSYPTLTETLTKSAKRIISEYITKHKHEFKNLEFSEKQVEISLSDGVTVTGRIDLVRRLDTDEISIVDLKSSDRAQPEEVTETQLHVYALGYEELTGRNPDYVEIYELDLGKRKARAVDDDIMDEVKGRIKSAAQSLRAGEFPTKPHKKKCGACDYCGMCADGLAAAANA